MANKRQKIPILPASSPRSFENAILRRTGANVAALRYSNNCACTSLAKTAIQSLPWTPGMPWRRRKAARRTGNGAEVHANSPALGADRKVPVCRSKSSSFGTTIAGRLVATSAFKVGFGYRILMPLATFLHVARTNLEGATWHQRWKPFHRSSISKTIVNTQRSFSRWQQSSRRPSA